MKAKVFVTRRIPQAGLDILDKECEVKVNPYDRVLKREELLQGVKGINGLLALLTDTIDEKVMDQSKNLRIISDYAVGYNNIDVEAATKRRIMVTNTPGVLTDTTADLTWTLLMSVARRIVESDRFTREERFKDWSPMLFLGTDIHHATLGIVGLGLR